MFLRVKELLERSYKISDEKYGEREAVEWSEGFCFPGDCVSNFINQFEASNGDFDFFVKEKIKQIAHRRMSTDSVRSALSSNNPEINKLLEMAEFGCPLFMDPKGEVNGPENVEKVSKVYKRVASAVNKMLYEDFVKNGLAFILPEEMVQRSLTKFHLNRLSWTAKQGKKKGRPIVDCSFGVRNLNSEYTKEMSDQHWGIIEHPTISDLVLMILEYFQSLDNGDWNDLVLWKLDLKGAYTLLTFKSDEIKYMGGELDDGNYIFFLSGIFGWNGTPAAFQVVTRAIQHECNVHLAGKAKMYVDDIMGVCLREDVDQEIKTISDICCRLFNSDCVESSKTAIGRRLDFIGYSVDLDQRLVSVSERNYLRCIYGFCFVDLDSSVELKFLERLASWGSRYSTICEFLRPLTHVLYDQMIGKKDQYRIFLDQRTKLFIQVLRSVFIMSMLFEKKYTRSLDSFCKRPSNVIIEFDASLFGGGCLIYQRIGNKYKVVGGSQYDITSLGFRDTDEHRSKYQNVSEFTIATLALCDVVRKFPNLKSVSFRGDSMSALTWLKETRFKSDFVLNASMLMMFTLLIHDIKVDEVEFITSAQNWRCDALSRRGTLQNIKQKDPSFKLTKLWNLPYSDLLDLCSPHNQHTNQTDFISFWRRILFAVQSLSSTSSLSL